MKKQMLDIAIVLTILLAAGGSAHAGVTVPLPDNCVTSLLLAGAAGGLGLLRKLMR